MIGQTLSHYKILKKIGQGGMGEVYLAEDIKLGRTAALKILPPEFSTNETRMHRFIQEARTASTLKHPNVVPIYEIGEDHDIKFIAMEFIDGQTLESKINHRPLANDEILNFAIQLADALDEAHSHGIIHRDIKAANIMVTGRGQVKILDFGLSKAVSDLTSENVSLFETKTNTEPGIVLGTVAYMSPEQALGKEIDQRSDIFSLGIVLYQSTTGVLPFAGKTPTETMNRIINSPPEAVAHYNYSIPAELERIIRKCLEKDPERRYQSAKELLIDLKNLKRDTETGSVRAADSTPAVKSSRFSPALIIAAIVILALAGYLIYQNFGKRSTIHSIAVLPFVNATADPKTEYLSDGLTESTINSLSQLPNLKVMARSTMFRFKGKQQLDPIKIGRDLNVDAVLTANMNQQEEQLLLSAELVNVGDGSQIWGNQYNRPLSDVLTLQKELANEISGQLALKLTGEQKKELSKNYPANSEAYQLYLQGRYYWNKRSPDGFIKAIELFNRAIEKDPGYALAYSGMADCYVVDRSPFAQEERLQKAKVAALKAIELDPKLAEAHTSLAATNVIRWNWATADKQYRLAIELNPNYATAHQWYAEYLIVQGRFKEALSEIKRAMELDPLSLIINSTYGFTLFYTKHYEQSLAQGLKVLEMDSNFVPAQNVVVTSLVELKRYDEVLEMVAKQPDQGLSHDKPNQQQLSMLKAIYQTRGEKALLKSVLAMTVAKFEAGHELAYNVAIVHAKLGNKDGAFEWLEKAYEHHDSILLPWIAVDPRFETLHTDPRFQDLVRRMGLPLLKN
jgi:eukaryotic-like serine/threonine-protein kinase